MVKKSNIKKKKITRMSKNSIKAKVQKKPKVALKKALKPATKKTTKKPIQKVKKSKKVVSKKVAVPKAKNKNIKRVPIKKLVLRESSAPPITDEFPELGDVLNESITKTLKRLFSKRYF